MSAKEHFDLATHIYTRLRRLSSRTIDVIWMVHNSEYAHEVLKLARATNDGETLRMAERYEQLVFGAAAPAKNPLFSRTQSMPAAPAPAAPAAAPAVPATDEPGDVVNDRYVGALR
jgi:hypothetical protein